MQINSNNFIFLFICCCIMLGGSCCKKDPSVPVTPIHDITPQSVYDYGFFMPGTHWVYKDSVSGAIDSVYVIYGIKGSDTLDLKQGDGLKIYEKFEVKMHSSFEDYDYYLWFSATWSGKNPRRDKLFLTKSNPGDYVGEIILCEIPAISGNVLYNWQSSNITSTKYLYPSYNVDSLTFSNVIRVHQSFDLLKQQTYYSIAKNAGVIKKEFADSNSIWKIIRYNYKK